MQIFIEIFSTQNFKVIVKLILHINKKFFNFPTLEASEFYLDLRINYEQLHIFNILNCLFYNHSFINQCGNNHLYQKK